MTIDEAIAHAEAQSYRCRGTDCGNEHAELARWLCTLKHIAVIARFGGLAGLSESEALISIRRLTRMYCDNGRNIAAMARDTLAALSASKDAGDNAAENG
jgi:Tfp pilus assembly protein PilV